MSIFESLFSYNVVSLEFFAIFQLFDIMEVFTKIKNLIYLFEIT